MRNMNKENEKRAHKKTLTIVFTLGLYKFKSSFWEYKRHTKHEINCKTNYDDIKNTLSHTHTKLICMHKCF